MIAEIHAYYFFLQRKNGIKHKKGKLNCQSKKEVSYLGVWLSKWTSGTINYEFGLECVLSI